MQENSPVCVVCIIKRYDEQKDRLRLARPLFKVPAKIPNKYFCKDQITSYSFKTQYFGISAVLDIRIQKRTQQIFEMAV